MYDQRFYYPDPQDIRSDLTYKTDIKPIQMFELIDGVIKYRHPIRVDKLIVNEISPMNGNITINGVLRVDAIETKSHIQITTMKFEENKVLLGDFTIRGNFNVEGDVNWSGKTNYIDSEIIRAEDNTIYMNHKGTHETAKGGGIRLLKGIDNDKDCTMTIDEDGYWNVYPGLNVPVLNVETVNFEEEKDGMLIAYLNGDKIGIPYKKLQ